MQLEPGAIYWSRQDFQICQKQLTVGHW